MLDLTLALSDSPARIAVESLVAAVAVYVFAIQWIYYRRKFACNGQRRSREITETILLSISCLCVLITVVLRILRIETIFATFSSQYTALVYIVNSHHFLYVLALQLTYGVLWHRQRTVYSNPAFFHLSNNVSQFVSKYFIIYIVFIGLTLLPIASILYFTGICVEKCYENVLLVVLTVGPFTVQLPLLSLMLFPLHKYRRTSLAVSLHCVTLMKRMAALTLICLISDVTSAIIQVYLEVLFVPLQVNLMVNIVCVTLIPVNWKERSLPCIAAYSRSRMLAERSGSDLNAPTDFPDEIRKDVTAVPETSDTSPVSKKSVPTHIWTILVDDSSTE